MVKYGMAIDLTRCMGCRACLEACKVENNTPSGIFWMWVYREDNGTYPNVKISYMPKNCMQCEKPPCVQVCPVNATYQRSDGITLVNYDTCIGCKACAQACPYVARHPILEHNEQYIKGDEGKDVYGSGSLSSSVSTSPPYKNPDHNLKYKDKWGNDVYSSGGIAYKGVMTKCTFCVHRLAKGLLPACVDVCPVDAITFGDLDDPDSEISRMVAQDEYFLLKQNLGTKPKIYYVTRRRK